MDFRRIPFQFSTTDPLKRQEELQRRFGLPANKGNMYVDFANPGAMSTSSDNSSASNSPRLQHRVPIFVEGQCESTKPSVDAQNVDSGRKPHVRVIPIEIEGEDNTSKKHRWLSGTSEPIKERFNIQTMEHSFPDQSSKAPRVCDIPIKIEGRDHVVQPKSSLKTQQVKIPEFPKHTGTKLNGYSTSKVVKVNEKKSPEELTLQKIQNIEKKLNGYHADVEKFSGNNKVKQYRYLDEMLTRCMLELDEIDTMGLESIRLARKAAVKKVQVSIDLLESKISKEENKLEPKEEMDVTSLAVQLSEDADVKVEETETEKSEETVHFETNMDNQLSTKSVSDSVEVTDALPEHTSEKVKNIPIMEIEGVLKSDQEYVLDSPTNKTNATLEKMKVDITEPVQITEVEGGANPISSSDMEPVIEEPLSDSKEENALEMDLDSFACESDLKFEPYSVQIYDVISDPINLKEGTNRQSDQNLEMEVIKASDISFVTKQNVLSNDNIQVTAGSDESIDSANVYDS